MLIVFETELIYSEKRCNMIDNTYSETISVVEESNLGITLSNRNKQTIAWQIPQAEKLSRADLHIHSTYSDGIPTIEQILKHTELHTDLDVIAITDHNVIDGSLGARDLWARGSYRFDFIVGEEVSTNEGHLLALFIEKHIPSHLSMERSIDLIHDQGGLAIVVHPLNPLFRISCQREVLDRIYANKDLWLDGIETWNAGLLRTNLNIHLPFYYESHSLADISYVGSHLC